MYFPSLIHVYFPHAPSHTISLMSVAQRPPFSAEELVLVDAVQEYWVNFARTGSPCSNDHDGHISDAVTSSASRGAVCVWQPASNQTTPGVLPSEVQSLVIGQRAADIAMAEYRPGAATWFAKWKGAA
jgi:hypothetical protein